LNHQGFPSLQRTVRERTTIAAKNGRAEAHAREQDPGFNTDRKRNIGSREQRQFGHIMLFMVIERFKNKDALAVYRRFRERGRMMPDGLKYVGSWVEANFDRCFQLMECDDPRLFQQWVIQWHDLMDFEIVPVVSSKDTMETISPTL